MTTVAELGEFGLIARLTAGLPNPANVVVGVGDDAAVLDAGGTELLVATCDAQVEDTHFRLHSISAYTLGQRALAVNLSDIAAMGAQPRFALISLLLPPTLEVTVLDGIYAGLRDEAAQFNTALVGGNIARNAERLIIDITLLGTANRDHFLRRDGARPGDVVMVTGYLGTAASGLIVSEDKHLAARLPVETLNTALSAQQLPVPRIAAGQWLAQHGVTTAIDVSDGLVADLLHICDASNVGVHVAAESLPILPEVQVIARLAGRAPQELALFGGEDYELIFTVPAHLATTLPLSLLAATGVKATAIGTICEETDRLLFRQGLASPLTPGGWDHLRSSS